MNTRALVGIRPWPFRLGIRAPFADLCPVHETNVQNLSELLVQPKMFCN